MNADLAPAVVAAGGGSLLMAGIVLHEHRRDEAMRSGRVRLAMRFPAGVEPSAAVAALNGVCGLPSSAELVAEIAATEDGITHAVWVPQAVRSSVESVLTGAIPGLRLDEAPPGEDGTVTLARRLHVATPAILSTDDPVTASRVLLTGLSSLRRGERVVVRWALRPSHAPTLAETDKPSARQREIQRMWRRKTAAAGVRVSGAILISAKPGRASELASQIESVLRSRRGLTGGIRAATMRGRHTFPTMPRTTSASGWLSGPELSALLAFPLGSEVAPGVAVGVSRRLPVPREVPSKGRVLFVGYDSHGERPVAQSVHAARHHTAIIGPTGVGKSSLIANCVLSDLRHGVGGVVIDPKGPDLVNTILDRIRPQDRKRVVVLDPAEDRLALGLSILSGGDPDLRAEALTGAMRSIFAEVWSVRSSYYFHLGFRTLAEVPGASLADLGRLFFEEPYRREAVARLKDPFLISAWQSFEALSEAAKAEHVAAPMNRVMSLLSRPRVRSVIASPKPTIDVGQLLRQRRWLLVSLSPGQIGEGAASLIAAVVMYATWAAVEARSVLPPQKRRFVAIYADELATLTGGVPFSFEQIAERARGLGAGLTVAMQTLGRIPEPTRSSLLGNVGSLITFRSSTEAALLARQLPGLSERDLMGLGRFEIAARIGTGVGSSVAVVTGRTLPLPNVTGMADAIRDASARRYRSEADEPHPAPLEAHAPEPQGKPGRTGRAA